MTRATRSEWAERVRRWRASGKSARAFAETEGFHPSTLQWWSCELRREQPLAFVDATSLLTPSADTGLVLEIGTTRIRVSRGFDAELLREVVAALGTR
jgi:hypothetical protein